MTNILNTFKMRAPKDYINGWVEACEEVKRKLKKHKRFGPSISLKINSNTFDDV